MQFLSSVSARPAMAVAGDPPEAPRPTRAGLGRVLGVALAALAAGCQDEPQQPTGPDLRPQAGIAEVSQDPAPDPAAVAQAVPEFGGYFLDASGAPTVYLTDPAARPAAEQALAGFLADRGFTAADLIVRQADYSWQQLQAWYDAAWPRALGVDGAVYSDIDDDSNRLRFGGLDGSAVAGMAAAVAAAGVPAGAAVIETTAPIEQVHTLRDRVRPVQGGYQINFFPSPISPVSLVCTMGFNVIEDGVQSFITNSHCTNVQGGTETPTEYYQPLRGTPPNPDNFIAVEVEDPHYDAVSCANDFLPGTACRYSDASRAAYAAGVPFELGRIARTTTSYQDTPRDADGNRVPVLEVDATDPTFRIKSEATRSVVGEIVNKVGRTTGWTVGPVIETCINSLVLGTVPPIIQRCQDRVRADVAGGDSGSPVFARRGGGPNVRLMGILWGGSVSGEVTYVFSPMSNIRLELGDFKTH